MRNYVSSNLTVQQQSIILSTTCLGSPSEFGGDISVTAFFQRLLRESDP